MVYETQTVDCGVAKGMYIHVQLIFLMQTYACLITETIMLCGTLAVDCGVAKGICVNDTYVRMFDHRNSTL